MVIYKSQEEFDSWDDAQNRVMQSHTATPYEITKVFQPLTKSSKNDAPQEYDCGGIDVDTLKTKLLEPSTTIEATNASITALMFHANNEKYIKSRRRLTAQEGLSVNSKREICFSSNLKDREAEEDFCGRFGVDPRDPHYAFKNLLKQFEGSSVSPGGEVYLNHLSAYGETMLAMDITRATCDTLFWGLDAPTAPAEIFEEAVTTLFPEEAHSFVKDLWRSRATVLDWDLKDREPAKNAYDAARLITFEDWDHRRKEIAQKKMESSAASNSQTGSSQQSHEPNSIRRAFKKLSPSKLATALKTRGSLNPSNPSEEAASQSQQSNSSPFFY